ncbi:hypothetical protein HK100_004509 [Physocladia obscura]|uniref:Uncharacterized protein n=1 Tax=Physocladia obscura TaxID=109957 RepID=A0AAD5X8Q4_9FUNG|nr:hypothetical protein HK100_004509 [Physocladia obscura]
MRRCLLLDHLDIDAACNGEWAYPMSNEAALDNSLNGETFETVTHSQEHRHKRRRINHSDEDEQCTPDQDVLEDDEVCEKPSNVFADVGDNVGLKLLRVPLLSTLFDSKEGLQIRYAELAAVDGVEGLVDNLVRVGEYAGWGGNHLLVIISEIFGVELRIFAADGLKLLFRETSFLNLKRLIPVHQPNNHHDYQPRANNPAVINIAYTGQNHYQAVVPHDFLGNNPRGDFNHDGSVPDNYNMDAESESDSSNDGPVPSINVDNVLEDCDIQGTTIAKKSGKGKKNYISGIPYGMTWVDISPRECKTFNVYKDAEGNIEALTFNDV